MPHEVRQAAEASRRRVAQANRHARRRCGRGATHRSGSEVATRVGASISLAAGQSGGRTGWHSRADRAHCVMARTRRWPASSTQSPGTGAGAHRNCRLTDACGGCWCSAARGSSISGTMSKCSSFRMGGSVTPRARPLRRRRRHARRGAARSCCGCGMHCAKQCDLTAADMAAQPRTVHDQRAHRHLAGSCSSMGAPLQVGPVTRRLQAQRCAPLLENPVDA